jgi:CRP-like cAMP-binding protein
VDIFSLIRKNALFADFTEEEINGVFECLNGKMSKAGTGTIIARSGEAIENITIILKGGAIKFRIKENGENEALEEIKEGGCYGDVEGFLPGPKYTYFVVTSKDSLLLNINIGSIVTLSDVSYAPHQKLIRNCLAQLARKVLGLERGTSYLMIKSMRLKLATLICDCYKKQQSAEINLGMNRNEMAEFLNVSRPSMSREMCRMRDEGMFDFRKEIIKIKNLAALEEIVRTGEKPKA